MSLREENLERFNDIAQEWDDDPKRVRMAVAVADAMHGELALTGTERALEFGCGTGLITVRLAPGLAHITAMDGSPNMLAVLRRKCEQRGLANVTLRDGNVPNRLPDASFDLVVSSMTLHHIEDTRALFGALFTHLVAGGRVALADLDSEDGTFHASSQGIAHHGFDRDAFGEMLRAAGFDSVRFSTAHTLQKEDADGVAHDYSIFLAVAQKPGA